MPIPSFTCAVGVCDNYYYKTREMLDDGYPITYHYFPRNIFRCQEWLRACNRVDKLSPSSLIICSIHFRPDDFIKVEKDVAISQPSKRKLKDQVIPSRNLTLSEITAYQERYITRKCHLFSECSDFVETILINPGQEAEELVAFQPETESVNETTDSKQLSDFSSAKRKCSRTKNNYKIHGKTGENSKQAMENSNARCSKQEVIELKRKWEQLLKQYREYEQNSKMEIERLKNMIKEKEENYPVKLRKILSNHLTDTEIDLVTYLRKQKNEVA